MAYKGEIKLGKLFQNRRERGKSGLPTLSVTITKGLINRDELERKTDTNLSPEEHLLVEKNDIAYNMMRMWQGASGLAKYDGIISPAYIVLKPAKDHIDPLFASYLFKSKRIIYLFWAYSYGLTKDRLRLYYNDFKKIPVSIPHISEQRKIAKILYTWDNAISTIKGLIKNNQEKKTALVQQLIIGSKRLPGYSEDWKPVLFSDLAELNKQKFDPKKNNGSKKCIELEHIESKTGTLMGYTDSSDLSSTKTVFKKNNVLFGKLRPYLRKFWFCEWGGVCTGEAWVLKAKGDICYPKYLFYLVQSSPFLRVANTSCGSKMPRAEWDYVKNCKFRMPGVAEQQEISNILWMADQEYQDLVKIKKNLILEKKALMQQLLTGKRRVVVDQ